MKKLTLAFVTTLFCLPNLSHALDCPADPEAVLKMISTSTDCSTSANFARECAWGSSMDVQFVGAATEVCQKTFFKHLKPSQSKNYQPLMSACFKKYEKESGTLYRSIASHCSLKVT